MPIDIVEADMFREAQFKNPVDVFKLMVENKKLEAIRKDYENAITWNTTCTNCANLRDKLYNSEMQLNELRLVCSKNTIISGGTIIILTLALIATLL